jgi:hypothetical protein
MGDFDRVALAEALDASRVDLGLTWRELDVQVTERPGRRSKRRIAASTFKGIGQRHSVRDTEPSWVSWSLHQTPHSSAVRELLRGQVQLPTISI